MTMEDKEIRFWLSVGKEPVYWRECGMDWEKIKKEYTERIELLKRDGIRDEVEEYQKIINGISESDVDSLIVDGIIPNGIMDICDFDASSGGFISKKWNIKIGSIYDILDDNYSKTKESNDDDTENLDVFLKSKPIDIETL
jgi:hypothetical protein